MGRNVYLILPVRFACEVCLCGEDVYPILPVWLACVVKCLDYLILPAWLACAVKCLSNIACEVCLRGKFVLVLLVKRKIFCSVNTCEAFCVCLRGSLAG